MFFFSLVGRLVLVAKWKLEVVWDMMPDAQGRLTCLIVPNWVLGKPAAFDITVTSPLTPITLHEASVTSGSTAQVAENRKHVCQQRRKVLRAWVGVCTFGS